jgi:cation diffusion facilitator CzcD-associated flavoprotein CzcO
MRERLRNDQELCDKLIPHYELGCRRATPGDGYLEALREKNARVNVNPIVQITESGIQTTHEHTKFDIIICATGFDVSFRPSLTASSGSWLSPRERILCGEMDIEVVSEDGNGRYQVYFGFGCVIVNLLTLS